MIDNLRLVTLNSALFLDYLWQVLRTHFTNAPFKLKVDEQAQATNDLSV
jgi:hypothetical protein